MLIQVKGGTHAGFRIVRRRPDWECLCIESEPGAGPLDPTDPEEAFLELTPRVHPGSRYSCEDCGMRRPS